MQRAENTIKITNNKNMGDEETVAPISFGDLKYWRGVSSILNPQALYNSRSAVIKNDMKIAKM